MKKKNRYIEYIDLFLNSLPQNGTPVDLKKFYSIPEIKAGDYENVGRYLKSRDFIQIYGTEVSDTTIKLTPIGQHQIAMGGFKIEHQLRHSPLQANCLSKWAIGISIFAILISIGAIVVSIVSK